MLVTPGAVTLAAINLLVGLVHGLINYIDTKANCRHIKKITCKGTLWQAFIRVYRLEIQSVMLVFSTQLFDLLPFSPSLWLNSPPSPTVCKGGGVWGSGPQTDKHLPQSLFTGQYFG